MTPWTRLMTKLRQWFTKPQQQPGPAGEPPPMFRCRDVVDLTLSYLEGTLDPRDRAAFEAHIADCPNCWRFLQTYRETVALGQQLREDAIPPDVRRRLETFLRRRLP